MVEQRHADIQDDQSASLVGVGERLYLSHLEGANLLSGLETYTFHEDRLRKAFDDEFGGASNSLESSIQHWYSAGQQIFDLSAISAMFLTSDALKTPLGRLKLPYESFFVHWGAHLELPSPMNGRFIEGCYVSRDPQGALFLSFVSSLSSSDAWDERSLLANLVVDCEGVYTLVLFTETDGTIGDEFKEGFEGDMPSAVLRWTPYIAPAINMLANCLCYLSSPKAEIAEKFPPEAPARLVKQATTGTPRERTRGASKLGNLGFRTIKLCGQHLAASLGIKPESKEMPPHWRKGHWWPARVGPGRAEIRMDWRDGVVVNVEKGAPKGAHIYKADPPAGDGGRP